MPIKIITSYPMQLRTDIIDKMNRCMLELEQSNWMMGIQDKEGFIHWIVASASCNHYTICRDINQAVNMYYPRQPISNKMNQQTDQLAVKDSGNEPIRLKQAAMPHSQVIRSCVLSRERVWYVIHEVPPSSDSFGMLRYRCLDFEFWWLAYRRHLQLPPPSYHTLHPSLSHSQSSLVFLHKNVKIHPYQILMVLHQIRDKKVIRESTPFSSQHWWGIYGFWSSTFPFYAIVLLD